MKQTLSYTGYEKVFSEDFSGDTLDRSCWNVELHPPGWVNEEWQAYVDSPETLYIQDGCLHIRPVKKGDRYESARISTEGKRSFTYGIFEAVLRVPKGAGYLPAFWLMAEHEERYGTWPCCGEIDICEIMGSNTGRLYGTLHYGLPHGQTQGFIDLENDDFAERFHRISLKWEEGHIAWYVDGALFFETDRWYATDRAGNPQPYPAPFDHPMYLIVNLAVGGSWVGNPDETTAFAGESLEVASVTVYQKGAQA